MQDQFLNFASGFIVGYVFRLVSELIDSFVKMLCRLMDKK